MDKILAIMLMALVTYLIRLGPFLLFGKGNNTPKWVTYVGRVLPPAVMGMLIVYSLKSVKLLDVSSSLPVAIAIAVTGLLHLWKRNNLVSILSGTAIYMALVQLG
ncbi:MAG TPA: AzlD domain-containing protein [Fusibacter sp.]|nr:AzlD domain-containing protein [Fusibacter sp.]